ncbi:MAG: hypothetical protein WC833_04780 [Bacteroidales bacterium]|jgi:hypothetical protein
MLNKSIIKSLFAVVIIASLALSGCGVTVRQHPRHVRHVVYVPDYRRDYEVRFNNNDRRISELRESQHRDKIVVIEVRNSNAKRRFNEFKGESKQEWTAFKRELDRDVRAVEKSLKKISNNHKKR